MPYVIPKLSKIRDDLLRDIKNLLPQADIGVDSDYYVRASSVASCVEGLYQHQAWIVKQIFPDTADTEFLEWHCAVRGLSRKPAVFAQGTAKVSGVAGASVPSGTIIKLQDGRQYETVRTFVVPDNGVGIIDIKATLMGVSGNVLNEQGAFVQVDSNIDSTVVDIIVSGGLEQENDAELLNRLLELLRRPPAGGNKHDYKQWAMSVPGVSHAFVYPLRRGLGTVDVIIVSGQELPSEETIKAVQDYIDEVRPVTAKGALVLAPKRKIVNINVQVSLSIEEQLFKQRLQDSLKGLFAGLYPGEPLIRSKVEALISNMQGVTDRVLVTPSENIEALINSEVVEWISLGDIEVSLL